MLILMVKIKFAHAAELTIVKHVQLVDYYVPEQLDQFMIFMKIVMSYKTNNVYNVTEIRFYKIKKRKNISKSFFKIET